MKFKFKTCIRSLFVLATLALCFFYVWGCGFGSPSGGTTSNPLGPAGSETFGSLPSRAAEEAVVKTIFTSLSAAFEERNPEKAADFFAPKERADYLALFKSNPEALVGLTKTLQEATMTFLSYENIVATPEGSNSIPLNCRTAEMKIQANGMDYYIGLIKIDGQWKIRFF